MNYGYVYCLTNESLPNIYKIGFTNTIDKTSEDRAKELFNTSIPTPYKVLFDIKVNNPHKYEKIIHNKLKNYRINKKREFFKCSIDDILLYFKKENIITNDNENNDFPDNYFQNYLNLLNKINLQDPDIVYKIDKNHLQIFNDTIMISTIDKMIA